MAGTMPHAIFVETDVDGRGLVAAYAAELPGCAVFAASDDEATSAIPRRVSDFVAWLRGAGEQVPTFVGDNWYEVERAAAAGARARRSCGGRGGRFRRSIRWAPWTTKWWSSATWTGSSVALTRARTATEAARNNGSTHRGHGRQPRQGPGSSLLTERRHSRIGPRIRQRPGHRAPRRDRGRTKTGLSWGTSCMQTATFYQRA